MAKSTVKDLSEGNVTKRIISFAIPLFFGMLFQQFYNVFDTVIVGNVLGVDALAGVGSTGSINFLILGFCNGVASGCAIPVAQRFGAKDEAGVRRYCANIIYLGAVFSVILTVLSCVLCGQILRLIGTLDNVFSYAYGYIFYIFLGIPVTFIYNVLSGIIRSLGDSKSPVIFLLISIVINIGLDTFFLVGLGLGVESAAIATVISQAISAACCFIYMKIKFPMLRLKKEDYRPDGRKIAVLAKMGLPMGLQYSITAIGSIMITRAINSLDSTAYVAGVAAAVKIANFFCTPFDALGSTMATFAGQNVGAGKYQRLNRGIISASVIGAIYAVAAFFIMYLLGDKLSALFIDEANDEVTHAAWLMLTINSAFYIPLMFVNVGRFTIQGMGFSSVAIISGVLEMAGRAFVALVLVGSFGFSAVCFASPMAWVLADAFLLPTFIICRNRLIRRQREKFSAPI